MKKIIYGKLWIWWFRFIDHPRYVRKLRRMSGGIENDEK